MHPNEFIPDSILDDPHCLRVWVFLLRNLSPIARTYRWDEETVTLRPNQALIRKPLDTRLGLSEEELCKALDLLAELNEVHVRRFNAGFVVELKKIPVSTIPDTANADSAARNRAPEITFRVFKDSYLENVKVNNSPKTLENAERVMKHAEKRFGNMLLSQLGPEHLEEYKQSRLTEIQQSKDDPRAGVTTVNIDVRTLKAAMEYAIDWGYLRMNPFRRIRLIHQEKRVPEYLQQDEFQALLSVVPDKELRKLFQFGALTGMRRGEILNLEWSDVDLERNVITVQSSENYRVKHGKNRIIPISKKLEELLRGIERSDPYVFVNAKGEQYRKDYVTRQFKKAVRAAVLNEALKFHSLRATCASWIAVVGVPPLVIKEILGHAYVKTTEAYTRIPTKAMREALEMLTLPPEVTPGE